VNKLVWMQEENKIGFDKYVWNWWPLSQTAIISQTITCDPRSFFYTEILANEGGFVNNPNDPGGATNKGVILTTWRKYSHRLFSIDANIDTLKNITDDQAYDIFLEGYWIKSYANKINNCEFAFQFVDFYYNAPSGSAVVLQRSINALGGNITEDWNMGEKTLNAANNLIKSGKVEELYRVFREKRINYYNHRADTVPGADTFRDGWVARANKFTFY
jgi:lysozyme family protein